MLLFFFSDWLSLSWLSSFVPLSSYSGRSSDITPNRWRSHACVAMLTSVIFHVHFEATFQKQLMGIKIPAFKPREWQVVLWYLCDFCFLTCTPVNCGIQTVTLNSSISAYSRLLNRCMCLCWAWMCLETPLGWSEDCRRAWRLSSMSPTRWERNTRIWSVHRRHLECRLCSGSPAFASPCLLLLNVTLEWKGGAVAFLIETLYLSVCIWIPKIVSSDWILNMLIRSCLNLFFILNCCLGLSGSHPGPWGVCRRNGSWCKGSCWRSCW